MSLQLLQYSVKAVHDLCNYDAPLTFASSESLDFPRCSSVSNSDFPCPACYKVPLGSMLVDLICAFVYRTVLPDLGIFSLLFATVASTDFLLH